MFKGRPYNNREEKIIHIVFVRSGLLPDVRCSSLTLSAYISIRISNAMSVCRVPASRYGVIQVTTLATAAPWPGAHGGSDPTNHGGTPMDVLRRFSLQG